MNYYQKSLKLLAEAKILNMVRLKEAYKKGRTKSNSVLKLSERLNAFNKRKK
jgi:hypothetical protein